MGVGWKWKQLLAGNENDILALNGQSQSQTDGQTERIRHRFRKSIKEPLSTTISPTCVVILLEVRSSRHAKCETLYPALERKRNPREKKMTARAAPPCFVINDWETKTKGAPSSTNKLEKCPPFVRLPKTPTTPKTRDCQTRGPNLAAAAASQGPSGEATHTFSQFCLSLLS